MMAVQEVMERTTINITKVIIIYIISSILKGHTEQPLTVVVQVHIKPSFKVLLTSKVPSIITTK
jgi:hypothetical protein